MDDRTKSGIPGVEQPVQSGQIRPVRDDEAKKTLVSRMIPIVDKIRHIKSKFGMSPYRVFLVHTQWSGSRPGDGQPQEISRVEILPTPEIRNMDSTQQVLRPLGLSEEGSITVTKISARFSEDDLMGKTPDLKDPVVPRTSKRNVEFFWEVVEQRPSDPQPVRRRYVPSGAPYLSADGFQWRVPLTKQDADRSRMGSYAPRSE